MRIRCRANPYPRIKVESRATLFGASVFNPIQPALIGTKLK